MILALIYNHIISPLFPYNSIPEIQKGSKLKHLYWDGVINMVENFEKINIKLANINAFQFPKIDRFILSVNSQDVNFEFLIKIKESANKLLIMGSGAYDPNRMNPPVFQRHAWIDDFEETVIIYNDPTLYLDKITIGWGQGTIERHYLREQSQILDILIKKLNFHNEEVYFYGSSAGGFMSLMLAGFIKGSKAIVNNPQTVVMNFWPAPIRDMLNACYPSLSKEEVEERFLYRINVVEFYKKVGYVPPIYYLQNISAKRDIEKQFTPFIESLKSVSDELFSNMLNLSLYANEEQGHKPMNKKETIEIIRRIISN